MDTGVLGVIISREEYDEYIYDYDTTNSSFIAMASILKRKGIKNYNFFLKNKFIFLLFYVKIFIVLKKDV